MLQEIMERSQLTYTQMASLLRVSRPTVYNWVHGKPPNSQAHKENITRICDAIDRAVIMGFLPLVGDFKPKEKLPAIRQMLMQALTRGPK